MKILFVISHPESTQALIGLTNACSRRNQSFFCFFTGDGVKLLNDANVNEAIGFAEKAIACEFSWAKYFPNQSAPIEEGSQTDHSAMIGAVDKVVSL
jgi:hypothetical protein